MLCKCLDNSAHQFDRKKLWHYHFVCSQDVHGSLHTAMGAVLMWLLSGGQLWMNWLKTRWQCSYFITSWTAECSRHMDDTMCLSTSLPQSSTVLAEGGILRRPFCESQSVSGASVNTVQKIATELETGWREVFWVIYYLNSKKQVKGAFLHICPSQSPRRNRLEHHWPFSK